MFTVDIYLQGYSLTNLAELANSLKQVLSLLIGDGEEVRVTLTIDDIPTSSKGVTIYGIDPVEENNIGVCNVLERIFSGASFAYDPSGNPPPFKPYILAD